MTFYNYILSLLTGAMIVFGMYYLFSIIFVHKKIIPKKFLFILFCFFSTFYLFFELMLSLNFSAEQYIMFHKLKLTSAIIIVPIVLLIDYKAYFKEAKLTIIYFLSGISIVVLFFVPTNLFTSGPVDRIVINIFSNEFVYNLPHTQIFYRIWGISMVLSAFLSLFYFLASKSSTKSNKFFIIIGALSIFPLHDLLVTNRVIVNIMLTEYGFFILIVSIFFDFLFEDRDAYLSVINLSKELQKSKDELEIKVIERTKEVLEKSNLIELEREKSERLLLNVLPSQIAERLKKGEQPIADLFEEASVIFIDIVDFTKISDKTPPQKLVNLLNEIFTIFDQIAARYELEKIKTIGDCFMAAAGIPQHRTDHAEAVARMALDSISTMKNYRTDDGSEINFRIGLDCGPIVAGVIGKHKFIYDLWGDMVNTASRMETHGVPGKIQCTERFKINLSPKFFQDFTNLRIEVLWKLREKA